MEFKIPSSYMSFGKKIVVERDSQLVHSSDATGRVDFRDDRIYIQKNVEGCPRTEDQSIVDFWHEYFHQAFDILGYERLSANEKLADRLALLTHEMLTTAQYDKNK